MDFKRALNEGCYCLDLQSDTKQGVIEEMVDLLVRGGRISHMDRDEVLKAVLEREYKMSTGVQHGVAIPHGKTPVVDRLVTALAFKREGLDFDALDGLPSRIFVMTISSPLEAGPHIEYLGEISRMLDSESVRRRLLEAGDREAIIGVLTNER